MTPSVSVVIPTYNRAHRVEKAIRSVQAQTYPDFEIIVVDDGSTDNTDSVMDRLIKEDSRIRFMKQPVNRGAQAARNRGIRESRGEWIAFLDSDDQWLPKGLEQRISLAKKKGVSVVHADADILDDDGMKRYGIPGFQGKVYQDLLRSEGPLFPALLVKKNALEKIGFLDESMLAFQEWDTTIRLAKHFEFAFLPEATFIYDCRGNDTISKQFARNGAGYKQILDKHGWDMWRLTGTWVMIHHSEAIAVWYDKAEDAAEAAHARRRANFYRLFSLSGWKIKLRSVFRRKQSA